MRIIVISSSETRSGGTRQAVYQFIELLRRGHEVFLCLPENSSMLELLQEYANNIVKLPTDKKMWRKEVEKLLDVDGKIIVHAFHNKCVKLVALWSFVWKYIEKRNTVCVAHRGVIYRPGNPLPYLCPSMQAFIPNSQACANTLKFYCLPSKIKMINNGVPAKRLEITRDKQELKKELKLDESFVFVSIGNDNLAKGGDILLRAFAKLKNPAKLLLVGYTKEKWQALSDELGISDKLIFAGRQENVSNYLQLGDVFVFPSRHMDSAPNTVLEAICLGLAVIASRIGGVPEFVQDNGILFPVDDEPALTLAMQSMCESKNLTQMAAKSLEYSKKYSITNRCDELEKLYNSL